MKIQHRIDIHAPIARVWDITLDVESLPDHTPTMTSVHRLDEGAMAVGSQARIKQPGQPERTWTVTELEPQRRFAWSTRAMGTTMTGIHEFEPSEDGTASTLSIDLAGPIAPLFGLLAGRAIRNAITKENNGIKTAAEAIEATATQ
jgi:uncharacterized membrane protein